MTPSKIYPQFFSQDTQQNVEVLQKSNYFELTVAINPSIKINVKTNYLKRRMARACVYPTPPRDRILDTRL